MLILFSQIIILLTEEDLKTDMDGNDLDPIEGLKENALSSYGDNRLDAIETLATFGEEAIPALVEITNQSSNEEPQQLARAKIRDINQQSRAYSEASTKSDGDTQNDPTTGKKSNKQELEDNEGNL